MKYLDKAANIAIILGVAVFIAVVARNEFHPSVKTANSVSPKDFLGKTVQLPGLTYPMQHSSLVLAISTSCHYCQESLPFYRDLPSQVKGHVDVVAVLPQSVSAAQTFLQDARVQPDKVISADLGKAGIDATPTLLLVNNKGQVTNAWIGLLSKKQQDDVVSQALKQQGV